MKTHAVLYALGRDRVGVADDLASALNVRSIDIDHSRMTALGGRFALVVQVSGEPEGLGALERDLSRLGGSLGFQLQLEAIRPAEGTRKLLVEAYSRGPSGLHAVTAILKRHDINIEDLETETYASSWTSQLTFHIRARISVPSSRSTTALERELSELELERKVEVVVRPWQAPVGEELATTR